MLNQIKHKKILMIEKLNLSQEEKEEIYNKYKGGVSMRKLEEQYPYSFTFIQKLVKSFEFEDNLNKNYPQKDGYYIVAICKKTNNIIDDYKNTSGAITNHLKSTYPDIIIESNYKRKSKEYATGKFWYDDYVLIKNLKKCQYCDWTTTDVDNKSGAYEKHLQIIHNISIEDHIKQYPSDESYFKKYEDTSEMGLVECKVCGKKLKIINEKHLNKHGLTVREYKIKYGDENMVSTSSLKKLVKCGSYGNLFVKKSKTSKTENNIKQFLEDNNIVVEQSKRKYLNGLEIDLYLPEHNIGIEYNGNLYHTELFGKKTFNYHLNKTKIALKNNIKLFHIHEDEWDNNEEIIKSKLLYLTKKCDNVVHARKCIIKEVSKHERIEFLNKNHIQGDTKSKESIGAYYNNELYAIMCFDNNRNMNKDKHHNNTTYELTRFCVKNNFIINGIASKLIKNFINNFNVTKIISFADRRWTPLNENNLYNNLGFECVEILKPDYKYYYRKSHRSGRLHKFAFGKKKLLVKYPQYQNTNKTEWEIMQELGYDRIWDCGKFKYELNIKKGEN